MSDTDNEIKKKEERLLELQLEHMEKEREINEKSNKMTPYLIVVCVVLASVAGVLIANLR